MTTAVFACVGSPASVIAPTVPVSQRQDRVFPDPPAEAYIRILEEARVFPDYRQDFMDRNPTWPYIVMGDRPKVVMLQQTWSDLLSGKYPQL